MAKFSALIKGTRARKRGVECTTLDGSPFVCDLRVINAEEEFQCVSAGCNAAREAGGVPNESDLSYQFAFATQVIALAAIDSESSEESPTSFFDGGVEQVKKYLDRERILLLANIHRLFQEQVSPRVHHLSPDAYIAKIAEVATTEEGARLPFEDWPRSTLESFAHSTCVQLWISLMPKSPTSSGDADTAKN